MPSQYSATATLAAKEAVKAKIAVDRVASVEWRIAAERS